MSTLKYDEIGYWSEIKLRIVSQYASAYSAILSNQPYIRRHLYIDAFAGPGVHISKQTGEFVPGSPMNALLVKPPFRELHFIDLNGGRAAELRKLAGNHADVHVYEGNCNRILEAYVFPRCRYEDYSRALCLLDPYGLHLDWWSVIAPAGQMKTVEIFLNFPVMDMNMNVLWNDPDKVQPEQARRMDAFWGDDSWRQAAYRTDQNLFGFPDKTGNDVIAEAFRARLKDVAGFQYVPAPMPMRNKKGVVVYYLFFASPNQTGNKIVEDIFKKYQNRGLA
jgi:three-Cys-motif partner protein